MTHWTILLSIPLTLALAVALAGCPNQTSGDDDDDATDCETIATVCDKVFECGGWGWTDEAECEEGFLGNPAYYTECDDEDGYLCCVADCMSMSCDPDFSDCEADCWSESCVGAGT